MVEVAPRTWIARLRTDRVAIFRASGSKAFNAAALVVKISVAIALGVRAVVIALAGAADLAVIVSVVAGDLEEVAVLVDSAVAVVDSAVFAVVGDDDN